jgi:hypothetical protein
MAHPFVSAPSLRGVLCSVMNVIASSAKFALGETTSHARPKGETK